MFALACYVPLHSSSPFGPKAALIICKPLSTWHKSNFHQFALCYLTKTYTLQDLDVKLSGLYAFWLDR
jgi:hypothetical protein